MLVDSLTAANDLGLTTAVPSKGRDPHRRAQTGHSAGQLDDRVQAHSPKQTVLGRTTGDAPRAGAALAEGHVADRPRPHPSPALLYPVSWPTTGTGRDFATISAPGFRRCRHGCRTSCASCSEIMIIRSLRIVVSAREHRQSRPPERSRPRAHHERGGWASACCNDDERRDVFLTTARRLGTAV